MKFLVITRGRLKATTEAEADAAHKILFDKLSPIAKSLGNVGHLPFISARDGREVVVVDVWDRLETAEELMADPKTAEEMAVLFDGPPDVSIWRNPGWPQYLETETSTG